MATTKGALEKSIFFQKLVLKESTDPKQKERARKAIEKLSVELDGLTGRLSNPAKTFLMFVGLGKPKILEPYIFAFTHYVPMNSHGGNAIAFKFVASDVQGDLFISEIESGKKVSQITNYERIKSGMTDRQIAKLSIENLLQQYGADKVYQVLSKG